MGIDEIDFSEKTVSRLMNLGKKDGLNALKEWEAKTIQDEKTQFIS
jgi:hypothetical protein